MGFVGELMSLEVEDKLRGFLGVKPTKTSNGLLGTGKWVRGVSVFARSSRFPTLQKIILTDHHEKHSYYVGGELAGAKLPMYTFQLNVSTIVGNEVTEAASMHRKKC